MNGAYSNVISFYPLSTYHTPYYYNYYIYSLIIKNRTKIFAKGRFYIENNLYQRKFTRRNKYRPKAVSNKHHSYFRWYLFKSRKGFLYFSATDLEIGIQCKVPVQVIEEGEIVLPARHFSELVRKLPNTKITISYLSDILGVSIKYYNEAEVHLKGWPGDEFPKIPDLEGNFELEVDNSLLKNMIKQTLFATSTDDNRPIFTGVLFEIKNNELVMVSTDTHRLVLRIGKINNTLESDISLIIPVNIIRGP